MAMTAHPPAPDVSETIRVMLVDDSAVVRGLVARGLKEDPDIEVIATAFNGKMAIDNLKNYNPDIILLDIEMPEMDGITALPELLKQAPQAKIIMVSTLTERNADISLKALELGASDYVTKPQAISGGGSVVDFYHELIYKIKNLKRSSRRSAHSAGGNVENKVSAAAVEELDTGRATQRDAANSATADTVSYPTAAVKAIAIGSSTGGPQALIQLFGQLKPRFPKQPIFITQHMPATFTKILAQHISTASGVLCVEAEDGMIVKAGEVYLAPGDYHMEVAKDGVNVVLKLNQKPPVNFCRPAVDVMLPSLVKVYGRNLLTVILTGMGQDGMVGAKEAAAAGGTIIAQDEASSVVWGMPKAVADAGICKAILPLDDISGYIIRATGGV